MTQKEAAKTNYKCHDCGAWLKEVRGTYCCPPCTLASALPPGETTDQLERLKI